MPESWTERYAQEAFRRKREEKTAESPLGIPDTLSLTLT